uniref:DNA-binding protein n=1 Tax=Streptomyces auratus AGR0001 TaxID=1160718 RepID=J2K1Q1_9ACTN
MSFKARDVEDLLTLYGVGDAQEREALLSLAREANVAGWWHSYSDVLPGWFQTYVGLEGATSLLRVYEVQFVHGLLQTENYAQAVVRRGMPDAGPAEIERRVALRMERQKLLVTERSAQFHCVLDEAALRRPYGERAVMREQLKHLIEVSERPNCAAAGDALQSWRARGRERRLHHARLPGVGPAGRGVSGAADERALRGQARRGGAVRAGDGPPPG